MHALRGRAACVVVTWLAMIAATAGCGRGRAQPADSTGAHRAPGVEQRLDDVFVTSLSSLPGRQVVEGKGGFYCQFFQYSGTGDYALRLKNALAELVAEGKKQGANAFINARLSAESHEIQGSKWHSSIVHICGDYVILR